MWSLSLPQTFMGVVKPQFLWSQEIINRRKTTAALSRKTVQRAGISIYYIYMYILYGASAVHVRGISMCHSRVFRYDDKRFLIL